ncbi:MAG: S1C family serine protease [bacterium JZ-2024 1]
MKTRDFFWALTGFGFALLLFCAGAQRKPEETPGAPPGTETETARPRGQPSDWELVVQRAVEAVQPAVVNINTIYRVQEGFGFFPFFERPQEGLGSGVIFDRRGYILTNNHVVKAAEKILVSLLDGRRRTATLVGRDPETDVAVLRVEDDRLPVAKLGNSEYLHKGQWVVAIGNPFGLESTATIGIVSAIGRTLPRDDAEGLQDLIQTDAAINPGNSGGALADLQGAVIGINTAVISPGVGQGIGFAIPINSAYEIARILIDSGRVPRPWLGVIPAEAALDPDFAAQNNLPLRVVYVEDMYRQSPAAIAGILPTDVLLAVNGQLITTKKDLRDIIRSRTPDQTIKLDIYRRGKRYTREVRLAEKPLDVEGV